MRQAYDDWNFNAQIPALCNPFAYFGSSTMNEAEIQNQIRLQASELGWRLWRNNVGAGKLEGGSFVRWGLANDSKAVNEEVKSGDLIGIKPVLITQDMVGSVIGQFISRECKRSDWKFNPNNPRDLAQMKWVELILILGGDAKFTTGEL